MDDSGAAGNHHELMRLTICAVGRLKGGPEAALVEDYRARFDRVGRNLSLGPLAVVEVDDRKGGGMASQAELLRKAIPTGALICAMDQRPKPGTSEDLARTLTRWRDAGHRDTAFLIGGADGLDPALKAEAHEMLSLGPMVWPHALARVMLAEQLYRAGTIIAGTPYHRA